MGYNSEADNKVVGESPAVTATQTEDVWIYVPTSKSQIFGVKVSLEICSEERYEDRRCDLVIDVQEALLKTMVGMYRLTQKTHIQEYKGTLWLPNRAVVE